MITKVTGKNQVTMSKDLKGRGCKPAKEQTGTVKRLMEERETDSS
jgi:hypothetical protein